MELNQAVAMAESGDVEMVLALVERLEFELVHFGAELDFLEQRVAELDG